MAPRTAAQVKDELRDVDQDCNGQTSFVEYLLLHFKVMILKEYFQRKGEEPDIPLDDDAVVGLVGVGDKLIEELYAPPAGLDPELEKMMSEFQLEHTKRQKRIEDLEATVALGGVKGMAAKNSLTALRKQDQTEMHGVEAKIAAAIKRTQKRSAEEVKRRMAERDDHKESEKQSKKGGLADRRAMFGN